MRSRQRGPVFLLIVSMLAALLPIVVDVAVGSTPSAEAAVPARIGPMPDCSGDENPGTGDDCLPNPSDGISVSASGAFGEGGSISFQTALDVPACDLYTASQNCFWDVEQPDITGCAYLFEGDPTDLRSCGFGYSSLYENQDGWPPRTSDHFTFESGTATRYTAPGDPPATPTQLRCGGGYSTVYAEGGDARTDFVWRTRGPKLLDCSIDVNLPRPTNLLGPSFVRIEADVTICGPAAQTNCSGDRRTVRAWAWVPVEGDLAPRANFEPEPAGGDGLAFFMRNTSVPFNEGSTTYEWDFGDGETSTVSSPTHTFQSTGTKFVRLTMRSSEGGSRSHTERIELEPPDLLVTVYNPTAEFGPGKQGNRFNIGDEIDIRVKVRATEGVGRLVDAAPVTDILTLPEQLEFVGDPIEVVPRTFRPGDDAEFDATIRAVSPGRVTIRSTWNADDSAGNPSGPWNGSFDASVTGLQVEILPDPDSFKRADTDEDGDIDADDNHVDVEVKVTNVTQAPITDVTKGEIVVTSKTDDVLAQFMLVSSPIDDPATTTVDESDFGDLAPGESKSLTWTYGAEEALHVDVSMLVTGNASGATVTSLGEATVKAFDNVVLEAKIDVVEAQSFQSGKPIRIDGTFTNVTDRPEAEEELAISFAISPKFTEAPGSLGSEVLPLNGAGAYFGVGGRTAEGLERFELAAGESTTLRAIVETLATEFPTGFTVGYTLIASVKEVAESGQVSWVVLDELEIDMVEKDGFSAEHAVTLGAVPKEFEDANFFSCDPDVLWTAEYIGCKLVRGVETAARGFGDLLELGWNIAHGTVAAYGYVLGTAFEMLMQDADGRAAIAAEIAAEMRQLKDLGHKALENVSAEQIALLVPSMLDRGFTRLHNAWCGRSPSDPISGPCNGSPELFAGELAEVAGENIDMVLEALVAARGLAKVSRALAAGDTTTSTVLQRLWARRGERALADAEEVIATKGARALPGERILVAGLDVTDFPKIWRDSYGLSQRQFDAIKKLTNEYGVNITFRSRAPGSIDLIESGRALPKPQGIKTKGVNDIDIDFLGYSDNYRDKVIHMEPPIPFNTNYDDLGAVAQNYADQALRSKRPDLTPGSPEFLDLRAQIKERVITRHDEWGKLSKEYWGALRNGKDGKPVGIKVDFDGDFNGAPGERLRYEENRAIELNRVEPGPEAAGRRVYEVKLQAPPGHPNAGEFLDVTGDVDFLAILKPDGTVLGANGDPAELAKRLEIYEMMRLDPIGMQHGESFTIAVGEKTRAKYLRDGVDAPGGETTLTVTPEQRMITTYFDDGLSTLKVGRNTIAEFNEARAFFRGIFAELASPDRTWSRALLEQVVELRTLLRTTIPTLFDVSLLDQYVVELAGLVEDAFSRDGEVVRPDGGGGLERYIRSIGSRPERAPFVASGERSAQAAAVTSDVVDELDAILDELERSGVERDPAGAEGGRWVPVDVDDVVTDSRLSLAPYAYLATGASAGESAVVVTTRQQMRVSDSSPWFQAGDRIVLDPGGPFEETATIETVTPLTLSSPLRHTHDSLTTVIMIPEASTTPPVPPVPPLPEAGSSLHPLVPARVLDTRVDEKTIDGESQGIGRLTAGSVTEVQIAGRAGVDARAAAVALNVTAVRPDGVGYVTLFPCGDTQPLTSSLNHSGGGAVGNSAIVKLNADGRLCAFSFADTDLVIDVNAWLSESDGFESLVPARLVETRSGEVTVDGEAQELGRLAAGSVTEVQIAGRGGVAGDADAVALNVTAIRPDGVGYVTLFPCGEERPTTSSLNYGGGGAVGNSAVVSLSGSGSLCVFTFADTDLVLDVNAWLADDEAFDAFVPARFFETRSGEVTVDGEGNGVGRRDALSVTSIQVAGRGGVPVGASAVALNVTAVRPGGVGYVTLFPCGGDQPLTSSLNYAVGGAVGNSGIVKLAADGSVCAYTFADTDLVIDVNAAWTN